MTQPPYRKLTSRRRSLLGYSQLWLGEEHLLLVRSTRLVERYQRFALRDIQAIVISDSPDLRALQALAVLLSLGWAAIALSMSSTFGQGFFVITGACGLLFAIIDIARGPRCRCVLHTAVSREMLSPVSRRNASWRFLTQVLPAIEAVQGPLDPVQLQAASTAAVGGTASAEPQPPEVKHGRSYIAEILFGLMVVDAGLVWIVLRTTLPSATGLLPTVYLAELVLATVLLARRHATRPALLVWGALTLVFVLVDISTVSGVAAWTALMNTELAVHRTLSSLWLSARETILFAASGRLAAGAIGLALCYFDRRRTSL
jgi:hypothetical protein